MLHCKFKMFFSQKEDTGLQEVIADIEEVVEAAQGLKEVSKIIKGLTGQSTMTTTLSLSEAEVASLRIIFVCLHTLRKWVD